MRKVTKILKWVGSILAVVTIIFISVVYMLQNRKFDAPYPDVHASKDSAVINKGRHIVFSQAHCGDCHNTLNTDSLLDLGIEPSLSGGKVFDIGIAKIYTPNLTSDSVYGLGRYTDAEIARAIRYGVHPNGTAMLGFMGFQNLTDDDLTAIISYIRTQKPVANVVPQHEYGFMGMVVKAFLVKPVGPSLPLQKHLDVDSTAEYGSYNVNSTTNCSGCHTKRDISGKVSGPLMAGGNNIEGMISVNLTPDSSSRIFGWTEQMFLDRMHKGKLIAKSEMPWNSFKRMSDVELKAVYRFLQTVPAAEMPKVDD